MKLTVDIPHLTQREVEVIKRRLKRVTIRQIAIEFQVSEARALQLSRDAEKRILHAVIASIEENR